MGTGQRAYCHNTVLSRIGTKNNILLVEFYSLSTLVGYLMPNPMCCDFPNKDYMTQLLWRLIVLIISLSGLVGPRFFQLAVELAKIFVWKCNSNWKVQASTPATHIRRPNINKMDSCLVTGLIGEMKTMNLGTRVRWRKNFARWHHTTDILDLDIQKLAILEKIVSWKQFRLDVGRDEGCLCVSIHWPLEIFSLSLSLVLLYVVWTSNSISG